MNELQDSLKSLEQSCRRFRQQQFTFISALERTREHAHERTKPVSTLAQVQNYLDHHCHNTTDQGILTLFLDIVRDLSHTLQRLESMMTEDSPASYCLEACRTLLYHNNDLSHIRAKYPHDEVNHLSCNEARNYYGGVVSLIPVVLDLLQQGVTSSQRAQRKLAAEQGSEPARSSRAGPLSNTTATQAGSGAVKKGGCSPYNEAGPWDTTKPAWRPPGPINKH